MELPWYFWAIVIIGSAIVLWKSSDQVLRATNIIGVNFPEGIRGATFNAVSSSMPELFSTLFYLLAFRDHEGFSSGIATTAGSGIFNILVIPGLIGLVLFASTKSEKRYYLDKKVIRRDSIWLLSAQFLVLLILILSKKLTYHFGISLLCLYIGYIYFLTLKIKRSSIIHAFSSTIKFKAWRLFFFNTLIIAGTCYLLVISCIELSLCFNVSPVIMALVVTAGATSIPDAFMSIIDAKNENYNDSFSNIIGSNIFDICIVIGGPVLVYTLFYGPIDLVSKDFILKVWSAMIGINLFTISLYLFRKSIGIVESLIFLFVYFIVIIYLIY